MNSLISMVCRGAYAIALLFLYIPLTYPSVYGLVQAPFGRHRDEKRDSDPGNSEIAVVKGMYHHPAGVPVELERIPPKRKKMLHLRRF